MSFFGARVIASIVGDSSIDYGVEMMQTHNAVQSSGDIIPNSEELRMVSPELYVPGTLAESDGE